ncbi:hypothetical protein [Desulfovirgula thermocuniculi]|nr:hypothetical protein [Desulfovirgula thermocuniculi]
MVEFCNLCGKPVNWDMVVVGGRVYCELCAERLEEEEGERPES